MADKKVPIKYTSRDFNSIRNDLIEYAKQYYPNSFKDFNKASFGALMIDSVAYTGDILSFYLDYQVNESFLDTAIEFDNVVRLGRQLGYKYEVSPSSFGAVTFYVLVPANSNGIGVDSDYIPVLQRRSVFSSTNGNSYTLTENVDFSKDSNEIIAAAFDESSSLTTHYAIKAKGQVISGELATSLVSVGSHTPFYKTEILADNVAEIISVTDSEGVEWFEVDELSQDTVYVPIRNTNSDSTSAPFILKTLSVPKRFTVIKEGGSTFLQFGHGSEDQLTPEVDSVQDPSKVILKMHGRDHIVDESFDPSNLLSTDRLGVSPANTTLTIVYRANSVENLNSGTNTIVAKTSVNFEFPAALEGKVLETSKINDIVNSLDLTNEEPILGDITTPTVEELKHRIRNSFAMQNRAVTLQDYQQLVYRLPSQFGAIKKCHVIRDVDSFKRNLNLYVLSEGEEGELIKSNNTIKRNLKTWINQYKMINDTIDILDAEVVNFGIEFDIVSNSASNKFDVLELAARTLKNKYTNYSFALGESVFLTDIYSILNRVSGVADTLNVKIIKRSGNKYSQVSFDIDYFTSPDGRYVAIPQNAVFELKFPLVDIKGTVR
jgi:hypothetical protein